MQKQITARHFDASPTLREYASERLNKLERFYDGITHAHVVLFEDGSIQSNKTAEITVGVYRQRLAVTNVGTTHEEAIDQCIADLRRQLLKYKDKLRRKDKLAYR